MFLNFTHIPSSDKWHTLRLYRAIKITANINTKHTYSMLQSLWITHWIYKQVAVKLGILCLNELIK